ncbi:MAG: hypothetical protein EOS74_29610 [Mesorhizobium sp.]|nr:MAG: hypothetical protein EOS74_29610 [Mesorhizobium sp.]
MNVIAQGVSPQAAEAVSGVTASKLRSFLYELAEGVTNYRTVHSLTEQVQHQYHGRFAIELIQNAYDALARASEAERGMGRIELGLVADRAFGTLYVANDGLPFSVSNFISVSQLGQSDKSPETSIGNKGIGFRSVLEICESPQIWSRRSVQSGYFDGYCFGFSPDFVQSLFEPIMALLERPNSHAPSGWLGGIVDWEEGLLDKFRSSVQRQAAAAGTSIRNWVRSQLDYLSPYLLPWPLQTADRVAAIEDIEKRGFATVVALPLKSAASADLVKRRMAEIDANSLLFLDKLDRLTLSLCGEPHVFTRQTRRAPAGLRHFAEIAIEQSAQPKAGRVFRTWRREIKVSDMPEAVRASILELPGQWPKLSKAEIALAVAESWEPEPGQLSIFLPTKLESGAALHVNAPFFGDMSRTLINFGDSDGSAQGDAVFNDYLLGQAADLALEAIELDLQGKTEAEVPDIVDLLAPTAPGSIASDRWQAHLRRAAEARGLRIAEAPWFLTDKGWEALTEASLLPLPAEPKIMTAETMRSHAGFPAYASALDGRLSSLAALSKAHGIDEWPSFDDQAEMIENIACTLHGSGPVDWLGFWEDVQNLFDSDLSPLAARKVLLCTDGQLHAGGIPGSAIYFKPRQSGPDEDDGPGEQDIDQIPQALRHLIAILDPAVPVSEMRQGRMHSTRLHDKLSGADLVEQFRREDVLSKVLVPNLPALPVKRAGPEADLCRDALSYGVRIVQSMQVRGEGQGALRALARLPVPCRGGWYRLETASFGAGWSGTQGNIVERYLRRCGTVSARAARNRLLRSPEHPDWAGAGRNILQLLREAGVHDGLRLTRITPKDWMSRFDAYKHYFVLPADPPAEISVAAWKQFLDAGRQEAQPRYNNGKYEVGEILWIPGLEGYSEFDDDTRESFFEAVLASAGRWGSSWKTVALTRVEGSSDYFSLRSPLLLELAALDWIAERSDEGILTWSTISARWYVPTQHLARGRAWTLEHLSPLPPTMAEQLDRDEELVSVLTALGMPRYAPDQPSDDPRLLECLADTAELRSYQNKDVFLGQVRTAWKAFHPASAENFPQKIIVHLPDGNLAAVTPTPEMPVYLPNARTTLSMLRHFGLPAAAIEPVDAARLSEGFASAYTTAVRSAADLQMTALAGATKWVSEDSVVLTDFSGLDETIPFILTIAALHGLNARGTTSASFNRYMDRLRAARVAVVPDLGLVPMVDGQHVAAPQRQNAVWMEREQFLLLDSEWASDIEAVADAFTQLIEREDLKFQIRKGLSEVWPDLDDDQIARILGQMDLSLEHYREILELWRGDLGPAVERLSHLMWVLSRPDQSARLQKADQRELGLAPLREVLGDDLLAETVLQAALEARDVFEFGRAARRILGEQVEMSAWNRELQRIGQQQLVNLRAGREFSRHRDSAAQLLRRIAATLAEDSSQAPTYGEIMTRLEDTPCPETLARAVWEISFPEMLRAIATVLSDYGLSNETRAILEQAETPGALAAMLLENSQIVAADPMEIAKENRSRAEAVLDRFRLVAAAWYASGAADQHADWLATLKVDILEPVLREDRSFYTRSWNERTVLSCVALCLPNFAPEVLRDGLASAASIEALAEELNVSSEQIEGAAEELEKVRQNAARRRRMVGVCGAEFDNTESNLSALFDHIARQITDEKLAAIQGFDPKAPLIPRKLEKPSAGKSSSKGKRTMAPKRQSKDMDDLVGAAGEIHAFRWLQRRYGAALVSPSNWVSAYSMKAYPDNAANVDEGRGCDIWFTHDGCTYSIEVKSSDGDSTNFTLGSSEIRLARDTAWTKKKRATEIFLILRVNNVLSTSPVFTLLPNPYDPRYQEHFLILDEGARVSYRP